MEHKNNEENKLEMLKVEITEIHIEPVTRLKTKKNNNN